MGKIQRWVKVTKTGDQDRDLRTAGQRPGLRGCRRPLAPGKRRLPPLLRRPLRPPHLHPNQSLEYTQCLTFADQNFFYPARGSEKVLSVISSERSESRNLLPVIPSTLFVIPSHPFCHTERSECISCSSWSVTYY